MTISTAHRSDRRRVRIKPHFTLKPIVRLRWRQHAHRYGEVRSGVRFFLFGIIPILTIWDHVEDER